MANLPSAFATHKESPGEACQIEPGPISSADKIRLSEAGCPATAMLGNQRPGGLFGAGEPDAFRRQAARA